MLLNPSSNTFKIVLIFSVLSCIYVSIFVLFLFHSELILHIGKFNCFPLIFALIIGELSKYALTITLYETNIIKSFKAKEFLKSLGVLICSIGFFYFLAVLFGASFNNECEETVMFSALLTVLTVLPSCLHLGAENTLSLMNGAQPVAAIASLLSQNMKVTLLGAWVGTLFIPLDWDRPWQVWPIPCSTGALLAFIASHFLILLRNIPLPQFINKIAIK